MRDVTSGFIAQKNAETSSPIWLYRVSIDGIPANDLFFAEWDADITYFKTDAGVDTAQVYTAFPLTHGGISESEGGQMDGLTVSFGNATREIQALIEQYDGLRGRRVTIRLVFLEELDDPDAYIEDIFFVDSCQTDEKATAFKLSSSLDVLLTHLPRRRYSRNHCPWTYKGAGCWLDDGDGTFTKPTGFQTTLSKLFNTKTVTATGTLAQAYAKFRAVNLYQIVQATDKLVIDLKCDLPNLMTSNGQLELTSSGTSDSEEWHLSDLTGLGITSAWQTFELALADFTTTGGAPDTSALNFIRWYQASSGAAITISWRNAYIKMASADACLKTLENCLLHANEARFGAFPGVPQTKVVRV